MTKPTTTVDLLDTIRVHKTAGTSRETVSTQAPVVIATTEDIRVGSVMIRSDVRLPKSAHFESKRYGPWRVLTGVDGFSVERALSEAGWHFFFIVSEVKAAAVAFTHQGAMKSALKKVTMAIEAQTFNSLEIVGILTKRFLGLHYVRIVAHPRHSKNSPYRRDLDPHQMPRNIWNFKQVLRRSSEIGRTSKAM